jgi:hypothetical protein
MKLHSGFLIDNCDEEVERSPLSPVPVLPPIITEESIQQHREDSNERRVMLVGELDAADAEQRQELKRQRRLHKKIQKKKKQLKILKNTNKEKEIIESEPISIVNNQEKSSDWIVEYDTARTDPVSQLTDMVRTATITDEDKIVKVNIILKKIKKQQVELRKLRQYVMSMLGEQQKRNSTNPTRQNSNISQDLLMAFLNQPMLSGCWLCSGKMYTEMATQCDHVDEQ